MLFSDARVLGNQLLMSGQTGNIHCTFALSKGGIAAETAQVLRKYGLSRKDVRKCRVMLADIDEWGEANREATAFRASQAAGGFHM